MWQSRKIKWDSSTAKLKDMCGSRHIEKGWHSPRRKKIWFRESATFTIVTNKYKLTSSTNKTKTIKGQTGKKFFETWRDCEELQSFPFRKDSNWTNKGHLNLAHEALKGFCPGVSKQFFKTAAGSNIERVSNKITILWYKRKHWWNYCTKINLQQIYWGDSTAIKSCILLPLLFN